MDRNGETARIDRDERPWLQLTQALRTTGHAAMEQALPPVSECPYSDILAGKLRCTHPALAPFDHDEHGVDTLRNVVTPGAELNAPLFTYLVRQLPDIQALHGSTTNPVTFAQDSVGLLREPLGHPQQWATAFVYTLGTLPELVNDSFLNDELAERYTTVEQSVNGREHLAWAMPTEDFTLRQVHWVRSRVTGSELDTDMTTGTFYPSGTRLGDIAIDEPTIGCPGNLLAFAMWNTTIDVAAHEGLWDL